MTDARMEQLIGRLLRWGVLLAAAVVAVGGFVYLARHGQQRADYREFHGGLSPYRSIKGIAEGVVNLRGQAIIQLGMLLLIATPVARVLLSAVAFLRERDALYVAFTLLVLVVLAISLLGSALH